MIASLWHVRLLMLFYKTGEELLLSLHDFFSNEAIAWNFNLLPSTLTSFVGNRMKDATVVQGYAATPASTVVVECLALSSGSRLQHQEQHCLNLLQISSLSSSTGWLRIEQFLANGYCGVIVRLELLLRKHGCLSSFSPVCPPLWNPTHPKGYVFY